MPKLAPIKLDDNTVIFIEATESVDAPDLLKRIETNELEELPVRRGGYPSPPQLQGQAVQSIKAIEDTIRAYTTYTLNAFKSLHVANIEEVTLSFGIEVGGEAGIPYVTKGTAKSNLQITVKCSFSE